MRNSINRSTINVITDRNDLVVDVAGIETVRGALPLYPRASHARATSAHATTPPTGGKPGCHLGGKCKLGKRPHRLPVMGQMHQQMASVVMSERLPQSWRLSRSVFTTSRQFAASIG